MATTYFQALVSSEGIDCIIVEDDVTTMQQRLSVEHQVSEFYNLAMGFVRDHSHLDLVDVYEPTHLYRIEVKVPDPDVIPPNALLDTTGSPLRDNAELILESD